MARPLVGRDEMKQIRAEDRFLFRLARGQSQGRLQLGEAALKFEKLGGPGELGFSSAGAYAKERLSLTPGFVASAKRLAKRLPALPKLRESYVSGKIGESMVELLARHGVRDPSREEELLELSTVDGVTVHAVRDVLGFDDPEDAAEGDPWLRRVTLDDTVPFEAAALAEATRMLDGYLNGYDGSDWFEHAIAEAKQSMPGVFEGETARSIEQALAELRERVAAGCDRNDREEERAERKLPQNDKERGDFPEPEPLPDDVAGLDALLRRVAQRLASRDLLLGKHASDFFRKAHWKKLGYATDRQYCRERLGMSRSAAWRRIQLARRCALLPAVAEALSSMDIGFETALLLVQVAVPKTQAAWLERAKRRTFKHLRQEVQAVKTAARLSGDDADLQPPTDEQMRDFEDLERHVLGGELMAETLGDAALDPDPDAEIGIEAAPPAAPIPISASTTKPAPIPISAIEPPPNGGAEIGIEGIRWRPWSEVGKDAGDGEGGVVHIGRQGAEKLREALANRRPEPAPLPDPPNPFDELSDDDRDAWCALIEAEKRNGGREARFRTRTYEDVALTYRIASRAYERLGMPGELLSAMCIGYWMTWLAQLRVPYSKWDPIHRRDRMCCASPGCENKLLTLHHILMRALGGDDRWVNLLSLCFGCHLKNIHERKSLQVFGEAPDALTFVFGKKPFMVVKGRDKRAATTA